jgi:hypothetical protein
MAYIQTFDQSEASMAAASGFPMPGRGGRVGGGGKGGTIDGWNNPYK